MKLWDALAGREVSSVKDIPDVVQHAAWSYNGSSKRPPPAGAAAGNTFPARGAGFPGRLSGSAAVARARRRLLTGVGFACSCRVYVQGQERADLRPAQGAPAGPVARAPALPSRSWL